MSIPSSTYKFPTRAMLARMLSLAGFKESLGPVSTIATGMLNAVFKIELANGRRLIIRARTYQSNEYGQEFAAERFAYYLCEHLAVPVPALHYVGLDLEGCGCPFAIFEYVAGPTLDQVLLDPTVTVDTKNRLMEKLGTLLSSLHTIRGPGYGTLTSIWFSRDQAVDFWTKLFVAEEPRLQAEDPALALKYASIWPEWATSLNSLPGCLREPRLVHGDIHGRNIIVTQSEDLILLDWEASRFRIAPYDFAQIRYLNLRSNPSQWHQLLKSYASNCLDKVELPVLGAAIDICQAFWHLRMGLFLRQFPLGESNYFGTAAEHIRAAAVVINRI